MRQPKRFAMLMLVSVLAWSGLPALARAQGLGSMQSTPSFGSLATPSGAMMGSQQAQAPPDPPLVINDTFVSFVDSAVPRNLFGLRFEGAFQNRQPMRAEYYHPKGGPGATGFPFVETRIDYQEFTSYAEYAVTPWFSMFMEAPYRMLNPEINRNENGAGDMRYGMKVCTWSSDDIIATFLLRLYQPTAVSESLGTSHWSIEPGILASYRIHPMIHLEGEIRYWYPLDGSDFAGEVLRYGLGVSYGRKTFGGRVWYAPVVEGIGWTVMSGKTMTATSPDSYIIEDAHGQTIINGYLGMRFGYGPHLDFYAGYGRSFTGHFWQRDIYRFEIRYSY